MTTPSLPKHAAGASEEQMPPSSADFVCGGRNVSTAQHIAGLLNAGQLESVGTPRKLPQDIWSDVDPAVVQEIWDRGAATGWRAAQYAAAPRFYRDELARLQRQLQDAGFEAMGRMLAKSRVAAERAPEWHPADGEEGRERP